jgi:hypothetical protein
VGGSVALLATALVFGAYDPAIDQAFGPSKGMAIGLGVQRLQDDFGLVLKIVSPRFFDDRLSIVLSGGAGWFPDQRLAPAGSDAQTFSQWSLYGNARLCAEASTQIAFAASRLYATVGPSMLILANNLSTKKVGIGAYGAVGVELFAGDELRAYPFSLFMEIGAVAHDASADVKSRTGTVMPVDQTIDRLIATGLAISGGVRIYLWR